MSVSVPPVAPGKLESRQRKARGRPLGGMDADGARASPAGGPFLGPGAQGL